MNPYDSKIFQMGIADPPCAQTALGHPPLVLDGVSTAAPTLTVTPSDDASAQADDFLPLEFLQWPEIHVTTIDEPRLHPVFATIVYLRAQYQFQGSPPDLRSDAPRHQP